MDQQLVSRLTQLRRDLHRIPEVDFDLPRTLAYVQSVIRPVVERLDAQGKTV